MSYDRYYNGGKIGACGCRPDVNRCSELIWDIYDDDCCDLVKIGYTFYNDKATCIINSAYRVLNELVCGCISRREFEIRYGLFTLTAQKINQIVIGSLRRVLGNDRCGPRGEDGRFLGYDFGCFNNQYCQEAVAAVICIALDYLREAADIKARLNLNRNVEECVLRLLIERLEDAICLVITDCYGRRREGCCRPPEGFKKGCKEGKKFDGYEDY